MAFSASRRALTIAVVAFGLTHCGTDPSSVGIGEGVPDAFAETGSAFLDGGDGSDSDAGADSGVDATLGDAALGSERGADASAAGFDAQTADVATPPDGLADAIAFACVPLGSCSCDSGSTCAACVPATCVDAGAVCADPRNGDCQCGIALSDQCVKPASHCLCPACGDGTGLCVTDAQQTTFCAGPYRSSFACQ